MSQTMDSYAFLLSSIPMMLERKTINESIARLLRLSRAAQVYEVDGNVVQGMVENVTDLMVQTYVKAGLNIDEYEKQVDTVATEVPFPNLPFPVMFIGFSRPINPGPAYIEFERQSMAIDIHNGGGSGIVAPNDVEAEALGVIVAETTEDDGIIGWVLRERCHSMGLAEAINLMLIREPESMGWTQCAKGTGLWAVTAAMLRSVFRGRAQKKDVTAGTRMYWHKHKVTGVRPQPYYRIDINSFSAEAAERLDREMREEIERALTFRHDRSGHNRLFVHRGELPLPEVTMKKLAGRGYSVWTDSGPDQEIADLMVARGHKPKEAGEWVATKTIWIESTVVGSPELPYIPGMRQVR